MTSPQQNEAPARPAKVDNLPALAHCFINLIQEWQVSFSDPELPRCTMQRDFKTEDEARLFTKHEDLRYLIVRLEKWAAKIKFFTALHYDKPVRDKYTKVYNNLCDGVIRIREARNLQYPPAKIAEYIRLFIAPQLAQSMPHDKSVNLHTFVRLTYLLDIYTAKYKSDYAPLTAWEGKYPV